MLQEKDDWNEREERELCFYIYTIYGWILVYTYMYNIEPRI